MTSDAPSRTTQPADPRVRRIVNIVAPLAVLAIGIGVFFLLGKNKPIPKHREAAEPPEVEIVEVLAHAGPLPIELDGRVVPHRRVELSAQVAGRIVYKSQTARAGLLVRGPREQQPGEVLLGIDPRNYELDVGRWQGELDQAAAQLAELGVEADNAAGLIKLAQESLDAHTRELERLLVLRSGRATTESDVDKARLNQLASRNQLATLNNELRLIGARRARLEAVRETALVQRDRAKLDLERTTITAPLDGVVVADPVEVDTFVQPGTLLLELEDTSAVEVQSSLRMEDLYWIRRQNGGNGSAVRRGAPAATLFDAENLGPSQTGIGRGAPAATLFDIPPTPATVSYRLAGRRYAWRGELVRIDGAGLDERTRTVPCRIIVRQPAGGVLVEGAGGPQDVAPVLVRGMFVSVAIHAAPAAALLSLPERAVRPGNVVWRVVDGRLDVQSIRIVKVVGGSAVVDAELSRLAAGDQIVVSPIPGVKNGMAVAPRPAAPSVARPPGAPPAAIRLIDPPRGPEPGGAPPIR